MIGTTIRVGLTLGALLGLPLAHGTTGQARAPLAHVPSAPTLGTLPHDCPANPPSSPTSRPPVIAGLRSSRFVAGAYPVWGYGFTWTGSRVTLAYGIEKPPHLDYVRGYGWSHKLSLIVADGFRGRITLSGRAVQGGAALRFAGSHAGPTGRPVLALDVAKLRALYTNSPHPFQIPSDIAVPHAGCYALDARWPGGTWRLYFAAGVGAD